MEKEPNYDNDGLDPSEDILKRRKKVIMIIPISFQKNQNNHTIEQKEIY